MTIPESVMKEIEKASADVQSVGFMQAFREGATFGYELAQKLPPASGREITLEKDGRGAYILNKGGGHIRVGEKLKFREVDQDYDEAVKGLVDALERCEEVFSKTGWQGKLEAPKMVVNALAAWKSVNK